nr:unnamed protein product [Spirometra erinaceieuropaei]
MSAEECVKTTIQTRAVRKRLRKYLPFLDSPNLDLFFSESALRNTATVFKRDICAQNKLTNEELPQRSSDSVSEVALWNGRIAIRTRAARKRLRKCLSWPDQSHFDLTFPALAVNSPIVVFLDDNRVKNKFAIRQLLWRSGDLETEHAPWKVRPVHGEGIKSLLNEFFSKPLANVVPVDFSAQSHSMTYYLANLGSRHPPVLRRLTLSLHHTRDLPFTPGGVFHHWTMNRSATETVSVLTTELAHGNRE